MKTPLGKATQLQKLGIATHVGTRFLVEVLL
jgi:hypothetical protein